MLNFRSTYLLILSGLLIGFFPTTPTTTASSNTATFRIMPPYLSGKTPQDMSFLSNSWFKAGDETETYEYWELNESGIFKGSGFTRNNAGHVVFEEKLQIQNVEDRLVLIATVNFNVPVLFTLVRINADGGWVFENKEHDSPNRLIYQAVDSKHLTVFIETDSQDGIQRNSIEYEAKKLPKELMERIKPATAEEK